MIQNPPFRLKILKEITALLKSVTIENGFQNNLTDTEFEKRVVRGRIVLGDDEPDTMVSIIEPPTAVEEIQQRAPDNTEKYNEWDLLIQGWKKDTRDDEPCDQAYVLAADVQKVFGQEKLSVRGGDRYFLGFREITEMKIGAPVVRPSEEVTDYGVFYLILTLKFVEDTARPFG